MKAGRITVSTRKFEVIDVPTPNAGAGQVRIKVGAAGVCLSDVHLLEGILSPGYLTGDQVTLGHEVAGTIDQVGQGVDSHSIGERVVVIAGERNVSNQITTLGFDYDGGWAEYVVINAELVIQIPDSLPFEQAAIIPDAVSTPWAAISATGKIQAGESVAVFGVGGLGIHAVQLLRMIGCGKVIAIDPREDAQANALARGADFAFAPDDPDLKTANIQFKRWLKERQITLPKVALYSEHSYFSRLVGGKWFYLDYFIDPKILNAPTNKFLTKESSEYHKDNITNYPEHEKIMQKWISISAERHVNFEKSINALKRHLLGLS